MRRVPSGLALLVVMISSAATAEDSAGRMEPHRALDGPADACRAWVDRNGNGRLDRGETPLEPRFGYARPPDEASVASQEGKTVEVRTWKRKPGEYDEVAEGQDFVEERVTLTRDAGGRLLERRYESSTSHSDGSVAEFEYDENGRFRGMLQNGPGNSSYWIHAEYDAGGTLVKLSERAAMGAYFTSGRDWEVRTEGGLPVRLVGASVEEASCSTPDEQEIAAACRRRGLTPNDDIEVARTPRTDVITYEYDDRDRVVARHRLRGLDTATPSAQTTRYKYDCD